MFSRDAARRCSHRFALTVRRVLILAVCIVSLGCTSIDEPPLLGSVPSWPARCGPEERDKAPTVLRLNHLQFKGTHNSYHRSLTEQLDRYGVRQFELDLYWSSRRRRWDVYHLPFVDTDSVCRSFQACLEQLAEWSRFHPDHLPVTVMVEIKSMPRHPLRAKHAFRQLDDDVRQSLPGQILTPNQVQRDSPTLLDAVRCRGWPPLSEVRGRFLFVALMDNRLRHHYMSPRHDLAGRLFFPYGTIGESGTVVVKIDDPRRAPALMQAVARLGLLVRSRADDGGLDRDRLALALRSGAHMISTDYPDPHHWTADAFVDGLVGCNPQTAPPWCPGRLVELRTWRPLSP